MKKQILMAGTFLVLASTATSYAQHVNKPATVTTNRHSIMQENKSNQQDSAATNADSTTYKLKTGKVGDGVVKAYKAIENGTVNAYKAVENGVVSGYKKVENAFVNTFLEKVDSTAATPATKEQETTNTTDK